MCADVFHTTLRHFYVNILDVIVRKMQVLGLGEKVKAKWTLFIDLQGTSDFPILHEIFYNIEMLYYRTVYMESYNENNNLDQGRIQELKKKEVASSKSLPPPLGALVFTSKEYTFWPK